MQFRRDCGYRFVEAASTDEAIAILQKTDIQVDVVLSKIDITWINERLRVRAIGSHSSARVEDTARRNARARAELCELGPTLKKAYEHMVVLERFKRLLAARAQQGRR